MIYECMEQARSTTLTGYYACAHASTSTSDRASKIHNSRSAIVTTAAAHGVACAPQASARARNERARDDCLTPPPAHAATLDCCTATQLRPCPGSYERERSRRALYAPQRARAELSVEEVAICTIQSTCAKGGCELGTRATQGRAPLLPTEQARQRSGEDETARRASASV